MTTNLAESKCLSENPDTRRQQLFVVKKHHATRLHYDFRLGQNGVLKSWAMPGGPSYWPGDPCEAIQVGDHRRQYAFFEGMITEGYGAGIVMVWDWGTWEPLPDFIDIDACLHDGLLKFALHGEKLKGGWTLARLKPSTSGGRNPVWTLIKEQDRYARNKTAKSILEEFPHSIRTKRTLEEIKRDWNQGKGRNADQGELFDHGT